MSGIYPLQQPEKDDSCPQEFTPVPKLERELRFGQDLVPTNKVECLLVTVWNESPSRLEREAQALFSSFHLVFCNISWAPVDMEERECDENAVGSHQGMAFIRDRSKSTYN